MSLLGDVKESSEANHAANDAAQMSLSSSDMAQHINAKKDIRANDYDPYYPEMISYLEDGLHSLNMKVFDEIADSLIAKNPFEVGILWTDIFMSFKRTQAAQISGIILGAISRVTNENKQMEITT